MCLSPSLRGRGLKSCVCCHSQFFQHVALFTRAWIEITFAESCILPPFVALFTRAWIEIILGSIKYLKIIRRPLYEGVDWNFKYHRYYLLSCVALFTRAWIEICWAFRCYLSFHCRPLYEGVDWNIDESIKAEYPAVALFTRAWIEICVTNVPSLCGLVALFTRAWIEIL